MNDKLFDTQKGFSLVEVIVAMIIIFLVILAVSFTVVTAARITGSNQVNLMATRYANDTMEKIKSYQYGDIGFTDGSPTGDFVRAWNGGQLYNTAPAGYYKYSIPALGNNGNPYWTFGGVTYEPQINIWWTLPQDVTTSVQEFPADTYKTVEVSMYAINTNNNNLLQTVFINSEISPGQSPVAYTGGNLEATASEVSSSGEYLKNINVAMVDAPPGQTLLSGVTGDQGQMNFFQIYAGSYDLQASSDDTGWMVEPDNVEQIIDNVPSGQITHATIPVDQPCYLTVSPTQNGIPINVSGTAILTIPYGSPNYSISVPFTSSPFTLELWPALTYSYNVQILVNGYTPGSGSAQFSATGTTQTISPSLTACAATVTVADTNSTTPIVGANVGITATHYTWNAITSLYSPSTYTVTTLTDGLGQATFIDPSGITTDALGSGLRYVSVGTLDYYKFGYIVTDPNYITSLQPFSTSIPAAVPVSMSYSNSNPDIRVRVQYGPNGSAGSHGPTTYAAGYPRWGVTVIATGTAPLIGTLDAVGTDGYAEVDFPNVATGAYTISCSTGNSTKWTSNPLTIKLGDYLIIASW
jgi:prepilin-type N-terminal cleavage/methylation domain-containing protein